MCAWLPAGRFDHEGGTMRLLQVLRVRLGLMACLLLAAAGAGCDAEPSRELQEQVRARWNVLPDLQGSRVDFHWVALDQFPHPTFQGGTAEAYGHFARLLVAFLESEETFDFLAEHGLFRMKLRNVFPSGDVGVETTFEELTASLGVPGAVSDEMAGRLRRLHDRIVAAR
jgi:hypothetical protein